MYFIYYTKIKTVANMQNTAVQGSSDDDSKAKLCNLGNEIISN